MAQTSKESACSAGDPSSISGSGRSHEEGNGNSLQHSCLENPRDRGAWRVTVHGVTKSKKKIKKKKDSIHCFSEIHIEPAALHFYLLRLVINWLISLQPHILLSPTPSSWPKSHPKGGAEPKSEHNQGQIAAKLYSDFWISGWKLFLWIRGYWAAPHRPISPVLASPQDRREGPESATETSMV